MKNLLKKILGSTGYRIVNVRALTAPQKQKQITRNDFFDLYFSKVDPAKFFFVEVGASDGLHADPLYPYVTKYKLSGVAVEPLPGDFELLQKTYHQHPQVQCVNAAIGDKDLPFYSVADRVPSDKSRLNLTQISSFNKESLLRELQKRVAPGEDAERYIREVKVNALTFDELTKKYAVDRIDFLQLDCEGYDYEVLKQFDFERFSPEIINFESFHFSDATRAACEAMLEARGYTWFRYGGDTCAYKFKPYATAS